MRGKTAALFAMVFLTPTIGAVSAQSQEAEVNQIPRGTLLRLGEPPPEIKPGTGVSAGTAPKIGKPINCTGASKATKPECFTATLQGRTR